MPWPHGLRRPRRGRYQSRYASEKTPSLQGDISVMYTVPAEESEMIVISVLSRTRKYSGTFAGTNTEVVRLLDAPLVADAATETTSKSWIKTHIHSLCKEILASTETVK